MNIREIKDLIHLMNENGLAEIEIESEGNKIKLRRNGANVSVEPAAAVPAPAPAAAPAAPKETPVDNTQAIKSPMVGTFYSAPAPDAEPYVKAGAKVEVGQVVCIIEAMKLMNEIKSEVKGVIRDIHIRNGEPVEFGTKLFSVV